MRSAPAAAVAALLSVVLLTSCARAAEPGPPPGKNRLALEMSPYLRQHAANPVDWYPWGEEALRRAREEDKPIFLSIGYSTCYWCHVMEEESFTDTEVAAFLNEHFVAIKVDREERPDLDKVYMTAVQIMTGRGGWPMSTWLTPEGKPFLGGTYFPKKRFLAILGQVAEAWQNERDNLQAQADRTAARIRQIQDSAGSAASPASDVVDRGVRSLRGRFDEENGGFSNRPKFPNETGILLLLTVWEMTGDREALHMATRSLDAMARGGIRDHLGGGFHRYATDPRWQVPHFEKMLYNQAWLGRAYLEAWRITGDPLYREAVETTLEYLLRDMTSPGGTFYSAEDAGHVGEEGEFYVWRPEQVMDVLGEKDGRLFNALYGVTAGGNFEGGSTVLHLPIPLGEFAAARKIDPIMLEAQAAQLRKKLLQARGGRERPFRDEKILTGWNGMMIGTLARAGRILEEPRYVKAAARAADSLLRTNRKGNLLLRARHGGEGRVLAFQEDYAWLVDGLIELYDATGNPRRLDEADRWAERMVELFWDGKGEGFFQTSDRHETLMARGKDPYDGAVPSGNSVAALDLVRLGRRTGKAEHLEQAEKTVGAFATRLDQRAGAHAFMLLAVSALRHGEAGPLEYGSHGVLRARATPAEDGRMEVLLRVADGWHLNANPASLENLVPTKVSASGIGFEAEAAEIAYPAGTKRSLAFAGTTLDLYEGEVRIPLRLRSSGSGAENGVVRLALRYQACNDRRCLAPETLGLEVPLSALPPAAAE